MHCGWHKFVITISQCVQDDRNASCGYAVSISWLYRYLTFSNSSTKCFFWTCTIACLGTHVLVIVFNFSFGFEPYHKVHISKMILYGDALASTIYALDLRINQNEYKCMSMPIRAKSSRCILLSVFASYSCINPNMIQIDH